MTNPSTRTSSGTNEATASSSTTPINSLPKSSPNTSNTTITRHSSAKWTCMISTKPVIFRIKSAFSTSFSISIGGSYCIRLRGKYRSRILSCRIRICRGIIQLPSSRWCHTNKSCGQECSSRGGIKICGCWRMGRRGRPVIRIRSWLFRAAVIMIVRGRWSGRDILWATMLIVCTRLASWMTEWQNSNEN